MNPTDLLPAPYHHSTSGIRRALLLACFVISLLALESSVCAKQPDTLPALNTDQAPDNFASMWKGFDPRAEPLETETLHAWEQDGVALRIVRFRIGNFKGETSRLAGVYGYPLKAAEEKKKIPGLLQIHGGGQYADYRACLTNAKRGYATLSIAWAGRIAAPKYTIRKEGVQLFWDNKTDDPNYRVTTDWAAVDGYHAPTRNPGNNFPSAEPHDWTIDSIESPRNSPWFLCALAARRALTFLEQQPEVDPQRMGVYGHSMGGKLTVMTSVDPRVKAAAPSCGGISDRDSKSELFRKTVGDEVSLKQISCPIFFLSPANDFHGRICDLPAAVSEIKSKDWRATCTPQLSHVDVPEAEVATQLWFDEHLQGTFKTPATPNVTVNLKQANGTPVVLVAPDASVSLPIRSVEVFYTHDGKMDERPEDREITKSRFWHTAATKRAGDDWQTSLPLATTDRHLWVYANVKYELSQPVTGAGYYYATYTADALQLSSALHQFSKKQIQAADCQIGLQPTSTIEAFDEGWEDRWHSARGNSWGRTTHRIVAEPWRAPQNAQLEIQVRTSEARKLVVRVDDYAAVSDLNGDAKWQTIRLKASDFKNAIDESLESFTEIHSLRLSPAEHLKFPRGDDRKPRMMGQGWAGPAPEFRDLKWVSE